MKESPAMIEVSTAGFFERVGAATIDLVLPYVLGLITFFLWPKPSIMETSEWNAIDRFVDGYNVDSSLVWAPLTVVALSALVWNLIHGTKGIEPFGRRLLKLKQINKSGQKPTQKEIAIQCVARVLSALTFMLGHLWLLADPEKRTFHDRVAGIYVIHDREPKESMAPSETDETRAPAEVSQ